MDHKQVPTIKIKAR